MNDHAASTGATGPEQDVFDVAVCGGGPVGLALTYLLGRAGCRVRLLEKRASTTTLPKGQYMHAQTSELYRQWGIWDALRDKGWGINQSNGQGYYIAIAKGPVASVRANNGSEEDYRRKWAPLTPIYPRKIPASDYEAAICRKAMLWPSVDISFNMRVTGVDQLDGGVRLCVSDTETGAKGTVHARYVVACDGAHSFIRNRLGRGEDNGPGFLNQVLVEFEAELDHTLGKDGFFHSFVLDPRYAGWFGSKHPETGLWRYSFGHDEDELPHPDVILARIRGALGEPDIPVKVVRTLRFDYTTGLLRRWREGNVLFAGDAAHWHSPWGGFGANSGIQDANNLAWKLALVLRGVSGESLLDTYEQERKPKALQTVKSATYNSLHFRAIVQSALVGEPEIYTRGEITPACKQFLAERMKPHGENAVLHTGYQLGTVYRSEAVIPDGEDAPDPALKDYVESTVPGTRAPHIWLTDRAGQSISLIDLFGGTFTLVIAEDAVAWSKAADALNGMLGSIIAPVDLSETGAYRPEEPKFSRLYRGARGFAAVLVRPDGFVACRLAPLDAGAAEEALAAAMKKLLARPTAVRQQALEPAQ